MNDVNSVLETIKVYMGESVIFVLFLIALLLCIYRAKGKERCSILLLAVFSILFVFNDMVRGLLAKITDIQTYYRFLWMIPILPVIAYVVNEQIVEARKKIRALVMVGLVVVFVVVQQPFCVWSKDAVRIPDNRFLVADETMEVCALIEADQGAERPIVAFPAALWMEARVYDPTICLPVERKAYMKIHEKNYQLKGKKARRYHTELTLLRAVQLGQVENEDELKRAVRQLNVQYIVQDTAAQMADLYQSIGCTFVGKTTNYDIFCYKPNLS